MAERSTLQAKLNAGIEAARNGEKVTARRLLQQVISSDPNNEVAWLWMASVVDTTGERRACLQKVIKINPNNTRAQEALRRLESESKAKAAVDNAPPSRTAVRRNAATAPARERSGMNVYLIAAGAVLILTIGGVVASLLSDQQAAPPVDPNITQVAEGFDATLNAGGVVDQSEATEPPTLTPIAVVVTVDPNVASTILPATFTPTFTPTATETPLPSATPLPLSNYPIVYNSVAADGTGGTVARLLSDNTQETSLFSRDDIGDIALNTAGDRIAFVRQVDNEGTTVPQLFIGSLSNPNEAQPITSLNGTILSDPVWSPDGTRLAFTSNAEGSEDIYIIPDVGGAPTRLTSSNGVDRDPAWSPDGRTLLFASDRDSPAVANIPSSTEIYSMDISGTNLVQLTDSGGSSHSPAWSPDGQLIAFVSDRDSDNDLYLMAASGQGERLITFNDNGAEDRKPVFSSDGRWIAFASNRDGATFQIYLISLDGETVTRVTQSDRDVQSLTFLPVTR